MRYVSGKWVGIMHELRSLDTPVVTLIPSPQSGANLLAYPPCHLVARCPAASTVEGCIPHGKFPSIASRQHPRSSQGRVKQQGKNVRDKHDWLFPTKRGPFPSLNQRQGPTNDRCVAVRYIDERLIDVLYQCHSPTDSN